MPTRDGFAAGLSGFSPDFTVAEQATEAATIRCDLARQGRPLDPHDVLIAGHARSLLATLVTQKAREFGRVAGLQIEDWEREGN